MGPQPYTQAVLWVPPRPLRPHQLGTGVQDVGLLPWAGVMGPPVLLLPLAGKRGSGRRCSALVTMATWWTSGEWELAALRTPSEPLAAVPVLARCSWCHGPGTAHGRHPTPARGCR